MPQKRLLIIILGLLITIIVVLGGVFLSMKRMNIPKSPSSEGSSQITKRTLAEIYKENISQKCQIKSSVGKISATAYIDNGRILFQPEGNSHNNILVIDNTLFTWSSDLSGAMKYSTQSFEEIVLYTENFINYLANPFITPMESECINYSPNPDVFLVPQGVNFRDLTPEVNTFIDQVYLSRCGFCDTLAEEDAASCLNTLNCND